jgi:feruloyl esterase
VRDKCLSDPQILALKSIYEGPKQHGNSYGYGFAYGGESHPHGWIAWLIGAKDIVAPGVPSLGYAYGVGYLRNFVMQDPAWSYADFDMSELEPRARLVERTISPRSADLSAFRKQGGKLLMFHGWADAGLSPFMSLDYVDRVYTHDRTARDDVRLFMLPGVLHCMGGPGPDRIDVLGALDAWVATGVAPDELPAAFADGSGARKVCAYPTAPRFLGGDGKKPTQFECR